MVKRCRLILWQCLLLLLAAGVGLGDDRADASRSRKELEETRSEVIRLQESLREASTRLDRLERFRGIDHYRFPRDIELFGEKIPLDRRELWERMDREFLMLAHDVPQVLLWMKRANRYFPYIESQLKSRSLPEDLKFVAIVESSLRPEAKSHAGAMGLWQFMPATGIHYRLRVTPCLDERLDPVKSTDAALSYLENLYRIFSDWNLAVAGYNAGEERVQRELKRQNAASFYDLMLPAETERYVFRIATAKVILTEPRRFGFELEPNELYEPFNAERLSVSLDRDLDLLALAEGCGVTYRAFRHLNPHLRESSVPSGQYDLYVSPEKAKVVSEFIQKWNSAGSRRASSPAPQKPPAKAAPEPQRGKVAHTVRDGETLWDIAQRYQVTVHSIQEWNRLGSSSHIRPGQRLTIHR
jgi:LysM repeat protein